MSEFMGDITGYLTAGNVNSATKLTAKKDNAELSMTDFLTLMVTQMTSQSIDQTADTSEMLNQMVQMQMITAITNLTDASIMTYAASLVGKEVTVGKFDGDGNLKEIVGAVTGTGTMGGEQVVFIGDEYYYMSEIMAVGRLPQNDKVGGTESDIEIDDEIDIEDDEELDIEPEDELDYEADEEPEMTPENMEV